MGKVINEQAVDSGNVQQSRITENVTLHQKTCNKTPEKHLCSHCINSLASLLWNIGKQYSPRCDAAERGIPSGAIPFAQRIFIEK